MSGLNSKYGSANQTDPVDGLHNMPLAEDHGKSPVRTFFDAHLTENLDVKSLLPCPMTNLGIISKVKVMSFCLGLTFLFLIMASYILAWDKKGLLFTPLSYQFRVVVIPTSTAVANVSPGKTLIDMKLLVKIIDSKLEYPSRKAPDEREIIGTDPHLFTVVPRQFLPTIKSPCWYEEFDSKLISDPYGESLFCLHSKNFKAVCERLKTNFSQHLRHRRGKMFRLRCLPYFFIIGQPKCGTTDLFHRLLLHPDIKFNTIKEPHWWTRKRFGYMHIKDGLQKNFSVEDYLDLFDLAARNVQAKSSGKSSGDLHESQLVTGEASASTMWDNQAWSYLHGDKEGIEPPFLAQDFIHAALPNAKIIIMLRDPVERLYSDYLYFKMNNKSAEDFHQKVMESILLFQSCLLEKSLRSCVYNSSPSNLMPVRLNLGMYIVFLLDWLTVFKREQILVVRLEDYAVDLKVTIKRVFDFLTVGPLSKQVEAALTMLPTSNTRRAADRNLGPMLPATRHLLREFYQPFNHKLASALDNKSFLWADV